MAIVINGSGTVTGLSVGGLPDGSVDSDTLASGIDKASISDSGDATAITIDSNENVGIGVTPESTQSQYYKTLDIASGASVYGHTTVTNRAYFGANQYLHNSGVQKYKAASTASLHEMDSGTHKFKVAPSGSADAAISWTTAMTIDNSLMIKLGTNNDTNNGGGIQLRYNNYNDNTGLINISSPSASSRDIMTFTNPNGQVGKVVISGSSTAYNTSSDYRLKENVDYTWDATTRLKQLKPARFNFIEDDTNTLVDGFIAHEVSSVVPEAVSGTKDAMTPEVLYAEGDELPEGKKVGDVKTAAAINPQGIDQSKLVPLLVKTIQELEARITALEE